MCSASNTRTVGLVATRGGYGQKVNVEVDFPGKDIVVLALRANMFKPPEGAASPGGGRLPCAAREVARDQPRVHRDELGGRCRYDGGRIHPRDRSRHRRRVERGAVPRARRHGRRDARLLAPDRGCGLAAEEPPDRSVRQDGELLQVVCRDGHLGGDPTSGRYEAREHHRRRQRGCRCVDLQYRASTASWGISSR